MDKNMLMSLKTPYYIINEKKLNNNFEGMKNAFEKRWNNFIIGYSFKTNSLPWVLDWMKKKGAYAEVVSDKEYKLALKLGYEPSKIILNGPYKGFDILKYALDNGSIVNLDSFHEIEWIKNNFRSMNNRWNVGLRINFDLESYCNGETIMGEDVGRFGFNLENYSIYKAIEELNKIPGVKITGLHGHHSTKTKSLKVFKTITTKLCEVAQKIDNELSYIDVGGCLFGDKPGAPTFDEYAETIISILKGYFNSENTALIVEPGAALIASPVDFVCKVIDVKNVKNKVIVTTDGSCMNINPHMHDTKFQIDVLSNSNEIYQEQVIAGYTCIEKDRMATLNNAPRLTIDDVLVFKNVGAYTMALSPLFIQYFPKVLVDNGEKLLCARDEWDVDEYLIKSYLGDSKVVKE